MPGLSIPHDERRDGERCVRNVARTIQTLFGAIEVKRNWYKTPEDDSGRFPMDDVLRLIDGHTPALLGLICRCAARGAFVSAQDDFQALTGLNIDARQFQRLAFRVGTLAESFLRKEEEPGVEEPPRVYVEMDGTGAPLRHEELEGRRGKGPDGKAQTHEVKVAAIFTEHPQADQPPWRDMDSTSYVATDERCGPFGPMVRAEFKRRFAGQPETIALGDGASWIWECFRVQFPWAIQIVDFHHAGERLGALAELVHKRDSKEWKRLRRKWVTKLWNGKIDAMFTSVRQTVPRSKCKAAEKALDYFQTHRQRMRYDVFRQKGYFIGSGVVEAACRTVVGQRFKCSGMHWSQRGLKHLLSIRTALLSNRYTDFWNWHAETLPHAA